MVEVLARPRRRAAELLAARGEVSEVETFGERLHVTLRGIKPPELESAAAGLAEALRADGLDVELVRPTTPSLEDVFIHRIRDAAAADVRPGSQTR